MRVPRDRTTATGRAPQPSSARRILVGATERERRDDIHRERSRMIIEHDDGDIGLELRDPLFGTFEP
jgi:hypothetical protein